VSIQFHIKFTIDGPEESNSKNAEATPEDGFASRQPFTDG
jgi:hypothetical protein